MGFSVSYNPKGEGWGEVNVFSTLIFKRNFFVMIIFFLFVFLLLPRKNKGFDICRLHDSSLNNIHICTVI